MPETAKNRGFMEYVVIALASAALVVFFFLLEAARERRAEKQFVEKLYGDFGRSVHRDAPPERYARIDSYFRRHPREGQLDDITWNDLGMDGLFQRMNLALSATGEEYLYHTLRSLQLEEEPLKHLEEVAGYWKKEPDRRVRIQLIMRKLGHTGKYSLYEYLENLDALGERNCRASLLTDFLFLPFLGLLWVNVSVGVLGIAGLMVFNILSYFKQKREIEPYVVSFAYVLRLLEACGQLQKQKIPVLKREWEEMERHLAALSALRRRSFWILAWGRNAGPASGNPLEVLFDYVRMVFHVDLIQFHRMLAAVRRHREEIDALIGIVGFVETSVCVLAFRESLKEGYCVPEFSEKLCFQMEEGYHPLLQAPVKNGILVERGVLLTGSNASGKSTFLKTAALSAVMAQTIHTCAASRYKSAMFRVYSSMALRDDLCGGESYYIVEIKALKRILDSAGHGKGPVLCFVDEVLRGTNTVERIAASAQILDALGGRGILCFAATHDIELTELLEDSFDNYHFQEEVREGDVVFDYKLLAGRALTRNAIQLLGLLGYDDAVIRRADAQAGQFLQTGVWTPLVRDEAVPT